MSHPLFTGTQAERDTILAALEFYRTRTTRTDDEREKCTSLIDRLCERLSAQGEAQQWESVAVWPSPEVQLGNYQNESRDRHPTKEAAEAITRRLEREGFGGDGKIFPLCTRVEPVAKLAQPQAPEPVNAELLAALKRAWEDKNWMLNNRQFLNDHVFDYMDDAIARAEAALAAQKGQP